jgi:damage-control phosphatase, subfamily I
MKVYYECLPCFLRQAREALDLATNDEDLKMDAMEEIINLMNREFKKGASSNDIGTAMHRIIKEITGNKDPYHLEKVRSNEIAEKFLPEIKEILERDDSLENHVKAAIVGNLIDFAALGVNFDPATAIMDTMNSPLEINDISELEKDLKKAKKVLYLADNTGEIIFDKLLIEKLQEHGVDVILAVKENPILNDACLEDALAADLDDVSDIVTTGTDSVGVIYSQLSPQFQKMLDESELIISKGLGNYEGLTEIELGKKPVYCLLNSKCSPIARDIGVKEGSNILLKLN